uniref:Thymidylate kinase n=1 Tax=uncultured bacterium contig00024 TaxID=1181513 RepID=A0A806JZC1_9BACT|nr:thymidylate kinase [uncultured bacterium contig00024]
MILFFQPMEIIPNFVVIEGGDGSGTTTQLTMLTERLKNSGNCPFFPTFEPTEGETGRLIRRALKKEIILTPQTLAMLFAADRNEHVYGPEGILEQANSGKLVICDRYVLSSLVYQGIECGDELPESLNAGFPAPHTMILLDIDPKIALERVKSRPAHEIYEYLEFQEKVREKYLSRLGYYQDTGTKTVTLDASKSAQEVAGEVWKIVSLMPIFKT